jgi:hypothetical protein
MIKKCFIGIAVLLWCVAIIVSESQTLPHLFFADGFCWADAQSEIREDDLLVEKKSESCIIINNRRYRISKNTFLTDNSGEAIPFDDLSIPCFARLRYYHNPAENVFEVISVKVLDDPH